MQVLVDNKRAISAQISQKHSSLSDLPTDCVIRVVRFLNAVDLKNLRLTAFELSMDNSFDGIRGPILTNHLQFTPSATFFKTINQVRKDLSTDTRAVCWFRRDKIRFHKSLTDTQLLNLSQNNYLKSVKSLDLRPARRISAGVVSLVQEQNANIKIIYSRIQQNDQDDRMNDVRLISVIGILPFVLMLFFCAIRESCLFYSDLGAGENVLGSLSRHSVSLLKNGSFTLLAGSLLAYPIGRYTLTMLTDAWNEYMPINIADLLNEEN